MTTSPVKTILAATDLSRPAFAAVRRAALIARDHSATLELLHVIPDSFASTLWNELRAALGPAEIGLRQSIRDSLDALVQQLESETGVRGNALVSDGKPFAEVTARSEAIDADLIVVGAHGENLLTPVLGTTAHRVLRLSRRPVLLVKQTPSVERGDASSYKHMVVATDFSADSAYAAQSGRRLFPKTIATLFHAYEVPFEAKLTRTVPEQTLERSRWIAAQRAHNELTSFADANLSDARRMIRHGPPAVRIREYAQEIDADLIVTGSEEVPRLQTALLGSVSLDLVTEAKCDVLLARTTPRPA
jgi:nucleotide-binding universal stress UspA family protein